MLKEFRKYQLDILYIIVTANDAARAWTIPPPPHFDSRQCVSDMGNLKPSSKPNGFAMTDFHTAKDTAVFWQTAEGYVSADSTTQNNMKAAQDYAIRQNPRKMTVELTAGGHILNDLKLFGDNNGYTCPGPCTNDGKAQAGYYWNCASMWFAQQATGEIHAFGSNAKKKSDFNNGIPTFWNIELPNLLAKNINTKIIYHCYTDGYVWYSGMGCRQYSQLTDAEEANLPVSGNLVYKKYYFEGERYPDYNQ